MDSGTEHQGKRVSWADPNTGHRMTGTIEGMDGANTAIVRVGPTTILPVPISSFINKGGRSAPGYKVGGKVPKKRLDRRG